jgi:NAD-dependent deacetylase
LTGLWANYEAEKLATPEAFQADPKLVWSFYEYRRSLIRKCRPNAAHQAIAQRATTKTNVIVITQNVDGFHQAAGNRDVIALHGAIFENRCAQNCRWIGDALSAEPDGPPPCPAFNAALIRPNVVWFGECLDEGNLQRATQAATDCDVCLTIGTSGLVFPAAEIPILARRAGKPVIEINPEPGSLSTPATFTFTQPAAQFLPQFLAASRG